MIRVRITTDPQHLQTIDETAAAFEGVPQPAQSGVVYDFPTTALAYGFEKAVGRQSSATSTSREERCPHGHDFGDWCITCDGGAADIPAPAFRVTVLGMTANTDRQLDQAAVDFEGWRSSIVSPVSFLFPTQQRAADFADCARQIAPDASVEVADAW